jgi:hypothetical protein
MPRGRKPYKKLDELKEKREYSGLPTAEEPATASAPAVPDIKPRLVKWCRDHDIANGWQRELMAILKDVL